MDKKLNTACLALVASAVMAVVPALASASPVATDTEGGVSTTVKVGSKIIGTSTGEVILNTSVGSLRCTTARLTGTVATNSGTEVAGNIETAFFSGTGASGHCTSEWLGPFTVDTVESLPWCLKTTKTPDQFEIRGGKCSEATRSLTFTLTSEFATCRYTRANLIGSFTTNTHPTAPTTLTVSANQPFSKEEGSSSSLCPSTATLEAKWDLYTDNASETFIWIS